MKLVRRTSWGPAGYTAVSPAVSIASTRGVKIHYLGAPYALTDHTLCDDQVRAVLQLHLNHPTEDYIDIAYNALVCPHGYVYEGRGAHKRTGANGDSDLNTAHYAVCALLGDSGLTKPTDDMLHGLRDAIEWLRTAGTAGTEIKGHRDGIATLCPGDPLYAWVRAGALRPEVVMIKGVDVSNYQAEHFPISGMDFAIIKSTEGRSYINPKLAGQTAWSRSNGLVTGYYHFLWPGNIAAQAAYFVQNTPERAGEILACDWENTTAGTRASSAEKDAFIREVKRLRPGMKVLLYCNTDFWNNRDTSGYAGDGLWVAHYGVPAGQPGVRSDWVIHQYTSSPLDTNVADFTSRAAMRAWAEGEDDVALTAEDKAWLDKLIEAKLRALVYPLTWGTDKARPPAGEETETNPTWAPGSIAKYSADHAKGARTAAEASLVQARANGELLSQLMILLNDPANPMLTKLREFLAGVNISLDIETPEV